MTLDELTGDEAAGLLELDPDASTVVFACGRKGTGKSHLTTALFRDYPYDRLLIDPTGDVDPFLEFTSPTPVPVPEDWPESEDGGRLSFRYRPNRRNAVRIKGGMHDKLPQWKADVDRWVGLAMDHGRTAVEIDDCGDIVSAGQAPPNTDDMLHTLRHRDVTAFFNTIRPVGIESLVLTQADYLAVFDMDHELDVRRLAPYLRVKVDELFALLQGLDEHEFLLRVAATKELYHCDRLPS
jgi:hypothetical protein